MLWNLKNQIGNINHTFLRQSGIYGMTKPSFLKPYFNWGGIQSFLKIVIEVWQGQRNVFEHGEDRSFQNGPSSPFPMQFNIMHVRYRE